MAAQRFSRINLLPKDAFEFSALGKFLRWSLTTGRVLVVLTEFVVILAFASRFYYDKRLNDLMESIDQKQAVVESYAEIEKQIRDILSRQKIVTNYLKKNIGLERTLANLRRVTPPEVFFSQLIVDENGVNLIGTAGSETEFNSLLAGIGGLTEIGTISIGAVDFDQRAGLINFKIRAEIKKESKT